MAYVFEPPQTAASYHPLCDEKGAAFPLYPVPTPQKAEQKFPLKGMVHHSPSFAHISINLEAGDVVVADYGAMLWSNSNGELSMDTGCHLGGGCHGCYRGFAREACCFNKFTGPGEVAFAFDLPGDILPFIVTREQGWVLSKGSFVCGTDNLIVTSKWKGCAAYLCSGEGGLLTHVKTNSDEVAMFFGGGFGKIQAHNVGEGQTIFVNTGLFFAGIDSIDLNVGLPGDCSSCCYSGEGWVMKFQGPLLVYTQNRDPDVFMSLLHPPPSNSSGGGGEGGGGGE